MSAESQPIPQQLSTQVEAYEMPKVDQKIAAGMGRHALAFDGFIPLGEAVSQYSYVRDELEARIKGQPAAINAIIEALERSEVRLPNDNRPIASFAFLGLSGVGKTETAKALSVILGGGESNIIRIDCGQYSNGHETASLIGSPAGFVGHGKRGDKDATPPILSPENFKKPGTVLLLDEIEKGHSKLHDFLLSVMEGEQRLMNGEVVNLKNCIIIMTSNKGAEITKHHVEEQNIGFHAEKSDKPNRLAIEKSATTAFRNGFKPEFINRLRLVVFHDLDEPTLHDILDTKLDDMNIEYTRQLGIKVSLSESVSSLLVKEALKERFNGGRALVRALESHIYTAVGRYTGSGMVKEGTHIRVFHQDEAPGSYIHTSNDPLIFTVSHDPEIKSESTLLNELNNQYGPNILTLPYATPSELLKYPLANDAEGDDDMLPYSDDNIPDIYWSRPSRKN